ncbi:MAG: sulfur reduction protein DsrE [Calditrichaeota bacterium]|nr:MAG: sulfur reduction protein DsrE [Calditrichota bacterium]MBL1207078.1 sulfur reduction protein DsrE [Calditrichota bacterium]NOG46908.1 sulfur reduction protein DsrE [Calditrichota bacterium]
MDDEGSVFIFMTSGPETPQRCATPFYMANIAAVMDSEVKIVFQIDGVLLAKKGIADNLMALEGGKLIIDFLKEAKEAGVELYCCSAALDLHNMTKDDLIDEIDDVVGAAWMMDEALQADVVLNY